MKFNIFLAGLLIFITGILVFGESNRIILKNTFSIHDNPVRYFFKYPKNPVRNNKGYIIIEDNEQLLIFDPEGKFVRNVYKKGEGPGEIKSIIGTWADDEDLKVFNSSPGKMMVFSYQGDLLREVYYKKNLYKADLLTSFDNKFYFTEEEYRNTKKGIVVINTVVKLFSLGTDGRFLGYEDVGFFKKYYLSPGVVMNMHFIQYGTENNKTFYLANNGLYDLKCLNLGTGEIKTLLKKDYVRVNIKKRWRKFTHPETYKTRIKYYRNVLDDILKIRVLNDKIWLFTSTFDEQNIIKVDVYDTMGSFKGSLDFPLPQNLHLVKLSYLPLTFYKDSLLIFENLESEGLSLIFYQIQNIPTWAR